MTPKILPKILVAPVGSLEAHCAALALQNEGVDVTSLPTDDVEAIVLFAADDASVSAAELFEDERERPLLMVTPAIDDAARDRARRAGAAGIVAWDCSTRMLAGAITGLVSGDSGLPRLADDDPMASLTARERDIVVLLREGATNEAIAASLGISYHTVRTHVTNVLAKLGVSHRYAVATMARGSERLPSQRHRAPVVRGAAC